MVTRAIVPNVQADNMGTNEFNMALRTLGLEWVGAVPFGTTVQYMLDSRGDSENEQ